jgi:hypothetical protein
MCVYIIVYIIHPILYLQEEGRRKKKEEEGRRRKKKEEGRRRNE